VTLVCWTNPNMADLLTNGKLQKVQICQNVNRLIPSQIVAAQNLFKENG